MWFDKNKKCSTELKGYIFYELLILSVSAGRRDSQIIKPSMLQECVILWKLRCIYLKLQLLLILQYLTGKFPYNHDFNLHFITKLNVLQN